MKETMNVICLRHIHCRRQARRRLFAFIVITLGAIGSLAAIALTMSVAIFSVYAYWIALDAA